MGFRFPLAAVALLVISFVFFIIWAVISFVLSTIVGVFLPMSGDMDAASAAGFSGELNLLSTAFGVFCIIFFVAGILVFFFFDVFKQEDDTIIYEE